MRNIGSYQRKDQGIRKRGCKNIIISKEDFERWKSKRGPISTHCVSILDIYYDVSLFQQTLLNNLMDVERAHSMIMTGSELYRNVNILTRILDLKVLHCCSSNESFLSFCHKAEDALPLAILYICNGNERSLSIACGRGIISTPWLGSQEIAYL